MRFDWIHNSDKSEKENKNKAKLIIYVYACQNC